MDIFQDATLDQKKSIGSFLFFLALCDDGYLQIQEIKFIESFITSFGLTLDNCSSYFKTTGRDRMYSNLNSLSRVQKEALIWLSFELAYCDEKANEEEMNFIIGFFEIIGINEDELENILKKIVFVMQKLIFLDH